MCRLDGPCTVVSVRTDWLAVAYILELALVTSWHASQTAGRALRGDRLNAALFLLLMIALIHTVTVNEEVHG